MHAMLDRRMLTFQHTHVPGQFLVQCHSSTPMSLANSWCNVIPAYPCPWPILGAMSFQHTHVPGQFLAQCHSSIPMSLANSWCNVIPAYPCPWPIIGAMSLQHTHVPGQFLAQCHSSVPMSLANSWRNVIPAYPCPWPILGAMSVEEAFRTSDAVSESQYRRCQVARAYRDLKGTWCSLKHAIEALMGLPI